MTLTLVIGGIMVLIFGGVYEVRTTRDALFPPSMFTDLTTGKLVFII